LDREAARAREARDRPLLLREPDPARDRRGARRDRVTGLPDAYEGGAAPSFTHAGGVLRRLSGLIASPGAVAPPRGSGAEAGLGDRDRSGRASWLQCRF